jgi:hypothetical protein
LATKKDLVDWVLTALREAGGRATQLEVAKRLWQKHESELKASGDLFYTWQYDFRWAGTELRKSKIMRSATMSPRGVWELA